MSRGCAFVTGAAGGIGSAVVGRLRSRGVRVAEVDKVAGAPDQIVADLADAAQRDAAICRATQRHGAVDIVVFAHGIYPRMPIAHYSESELDRVLSVNFSSVFHLSRLFMARPEERPSRMIFVGSQAAVTGGFDPAYAASKAAVTALAKSIAREFGPAGIVSNVVSPGPVDTPMAAVMDDERRRLYEAAIPLRRFATADEVASVVEWVALDASGITGSSFDVDGGLVRR